MINIPVIKRFFHRFTSRLLIGLVVIHVILIPVLVEVNRVIDTGVVENQFYGIAVDATHLFEPYVVNQIKAGNKENIQTTINKLVTDGVIHSITVSVANTQAPNLSYQLTSIAKSVDPNSNPLYAKSNEAYYYEITNSEDIPGIRYTLRIGFGRTSVSDAVDFSFEQSVWVLAIYFVVLMIAATTLARYLVAPLQALRQATYRISSGRVNENLEVNTEIEEIRSLAKDLDRMRAKLVNQTREFGNLSLTDVLTQLPNRNLLYDRLIQATLVADKPPESFALLLMDLDHFKHVNDALGHHVGDVIIKETAVRLQDAVRPSDTVARLGGDEFAIYLRNATIAEARDLAYRVFKALEPPFKYEGYTLHITASIGAAIFPEHGLNHIDLLRRADVAMYTAKNKPNNKELVIYDSELDRNSIRQLQLGNELRRGIHEGELSLYYQPQINLNTNQVIGAEALIRWIHPERGMISPDDFIGIAEKTGLIIELTEFVLRTAMSQVKQWHDDGFKLSVAVNISAKNLLGNELLENVLSLMQELQIDPGCVELELTESAIIVDPLRSINVLEQLARAGLKISIDDFGTGYSSLVYLRDLPVSALKIDQSFVMDMIENESDAAIVRAIIDLAHNLNLLVVAEGVENHEILSVLRALDCDMIQGYHISKALSAPEFTRKLKAGGWKI